MNIIPRCEHGPFCTGAPMHYPLIPENAFERWLVRFFPPLQYPGLRPIPKRSPEANQD